ncbi:UNVERIFIED_CONTAM: hypothetical protein HDU68_011968 [Siphonaria sp. JEL0065]|nr:hypothetical protein HDU68_011968 [Siphonaria sp. JEL0065]
MTNPAKPIQELINAHRFIRAVWTDEFTRSKFSEAWTSFDEATRRQVVKSVAPKSPESLENASVVIDGQTVDMSGFAQMLPELCTANLVKEKTLLNTFSKLTGSGTFSAAAFDQLVLLRMGMMRGDVKFDPSHDPSILIIIYVDEDFGKIVRLADPEVNPNHEVVNKNVLEMKKKGHAIPTWEFEMLMTRMRFLIEHCVLLFQATKKYTLKKSGGCWTCGKLACDDGTKLLKCVKCGAASYCSRDCQIKDWKEGHKSECGKSA